VRSLRSRLILGFSLVAIIPTLVATMLLGRRIQQSVNAQAAERLSGALGVLIEQMSSDATWNGVKLGLLARDPQLKRLYLVESASGPELREFLANQQFLLDVDFLWVTDTTGRVLADGAMGLTDRPRRSVRDPVPTYALDGVRVAGSGLVRLSGAPALAFVDDAPIRYLDKRVGMLRGGVVLDSALLARAGRAGGVELVLHDATGRVVASTLAGGENIRVAHADQSERVVLQGRSYLARRVTLEGGARITGLVSTAAADEMVGALRATSLLLGLLGVAIAIALGLLWSLQISRPVERLAAFSTRIAHGDWEEPLALESVRELQALVAALERMRSDLTTYRTRLTASERQAAYGQMARAVAHEIRNPLTPIAISVADLKRSYELQRPEFAGILDQAVRTIGEEVERLKHLLQEFSDFGRFPAPRPEEFEAGDLASDVRTLFGHQVAAGRLAITAGTEGRVIADRAQLKQALLNLTQNALEAAGDDGRVDLAIESREGMLEIAVSNTGPELTDEQRSQLFVPGFTTKAHGSGLGLTIVERIVSDHRGTIAVESAAGRGVTFRIRLPMGSEA